MRMSYVNGAVIPHAQARIHVEDRGFQFSDGIYEVMAVLDGKLVDSAAHMARLERSLSEIRMGMPMTARALVMVMRELLRRNRIFMGLVYAQVTRGASPRDFRFPVKETPQSLVITCKKLDLFRAGIMERGAGAITVPDLRWLRRDIKSTGLLAQVLAKQRAVDAGAYEAIMVDGQGFVTEGASTNVFIVDKGGTLITRPADTMILSGVTRRSLLELCRRSGIPLEERPFAPEEMLEARECFITAATTWCLPIISIDGRAIGGGVPGPICARLRSIYTDYVRTNISLAKPEWIA